MCSLLGKATKNSLHKSLKEFISPRNRNVIRRQLKAENDLIERESICFLLPEWQSRNKGTKTPSNDQAEFSFEFSQCADLVAFHAAGHQGCTHEPWPRSRRIDCITWNVVLSVNTSAAASTPVYFSTTGAAAVRAISSR